MHSASAVIYIYIKADVTNRTSGVTQKMLNIFFLTMPHAYSIAVNIRRFQASCTRPIGYTRY